MASRQEITAAARAYVGVPFRDRGRSRNGLDCVGLVVRVLDDLGIAYPEGDFLGYRSFARTGLMIEQMTARFGSPAPASSALPGDLVVMRWDERIGHLIFISEEQRAIHAWSLFGVVEHTISPIWRASMVAAFSLPGTS